MEDLQQQHHMINTAEESLIEVNGIPVVVVPEDHSVHQFQELMGRPQRIEQTVRLLDLDSFVSYVSRYANDNTTVMIGPDGVEATIDYHGKDEPEWCRHRAKMPLTHSTSWEAWARIDGRLMAQADFARFIRDNKDDVIEPGSLKMVEIAKTLQAQSKVNWVSMQDDHQGDVALRYEKQTDMQAGARGEIEVPQHVTVRMSPYVGIDLYDVDVEFLVRMDDGLLRMGIRIVRRDRIIEDAQQLVREAIVNRLPTVHVYRTP